MSRILLRDLTPGTNYVIQLRTDAGDSVSEWSRLFEVTTTSDAESPDIPVLISPVADAWAVDGDTFVGQWQPLDFNLEKNKDFDHYEVELSNGTKTAVVRTTNMVYVLSFEQNRIFFGTPAATVTFRVRSVDLVGNVSAWTATESESNPAPAPVGSLVTTPLYDSIDVSWEASSESDFKNYTVQVSTNGVGGTYNTVYSGTNNSYTHKSTQFATDHFFKVFVVDKFGTISTAVTSSAVRPKSTFSSSDTTAPAFSGPLTLSQNWDTETESAYIDVSWTASSDTDLDGYEIRWSTVNGSQWRYRRVGRDVTSTRLDGLQSGVSYYVAVRAVDFSGNPSAWVDAPAGSFPITVNFDTASPSKPATPTASTTVDALKLQVNHNGQKAVGGALEPDTDHFRVYASRTSGFAVSDANLIGTMKFGFAASQVFMVPAEGTGTATTEAWYVKVVAVDRHGNYNTANASDQVAATVGLIETANIGYAQITNAKIADLAVDKLTAGTGLATDFTIKSTLTLGEAGNDGVIQSFGYTPGGTTGFSLDSDGLVIKSGTIEAAALKIQVGQNVIPPEYADFEGPKSVYESKLFFNSTGTAGAWDISTANKKFNSQSLKITNNGTWAQAWLSSDGTDTGYSVPAEAGNVVIISVYAMAPSGGGSKTMNIYKRDMEDAGVSGANVTGTTHTVPGDGIWRRYHAVYTVPTASTSTAFMPVFRNSTVGDLYVDGIQVEYALSQLTTPSYWAPSTSTTINGGMIRTGEIRSNSNLTLNGVTLPTWAINTSGAAQFGDMLIRGNTIVGASDAEGDLSYIKSYNYTEGSAGWIIRSDGTAELRQLASDSISGESIIAETLSGEKIIASTLQVDRLASGGMDASIELLGSITANGLLGEAVSMSADGFSVYGPDEVNVTNKALTTNVATLTTASPHGMEVGSPIIIEGVGAPFDGDAVISSVTASTISYEVINADIASATATGIVKGKDATGTNVGPRFIHFPTDGTQPNIISGKLTADSLVVQEGASLRGTTNIEPGAAITISHKQVPPKSSPTVSFNYSDTSVSGLRYNKKDVAFGHNGNLFVLSDDSASDAWEVVEIDPTNGTKVATRKSGTTGDATGLAYFNNHYYVMRWTHNPKGGYVYYVDVYNTSFVLEQTVDHTVLGPDWPVVSFGKVPPTGLDKARLGWDHTNNRLIMAWVSSTDEMTVRYYSIDVNGVPTGPSGSAVTLPSTSGSTEVAGVVRGSLDLGGDRLVIRNQSAGNETARKNVLVFNASHFYVPAESWPFAYNHASKGFDWRVSTGKFYDLGSNNILKEYFHGDSHWTTDSADRWLAYTWYRSANSAPGGTNAAYETTISPAVKVTLPKRARMNVTTSPIPFADTEQAPNMARVYLSKSTSNTAPDGSDTSWNRRAEITYPSTNSNIDPYGVLTNPGPPTVNGFDSIGGDTPGMIVSTSGASFWKGDDTAQFYQLVLQSNTDASTAAGNKPALRVGSPDSLHLRIDNNEIIAMNNDATQATLFLNAGGRVQVGYKSWRTGTQTLQTATANSTVSTNITFNPAFDMTPAILLSLMTGQSAAHDTTVWADNISTTGFRLNMWRNNTFAVTVRWVAADL